MSKFIPSILLLFSVSLILTSQTYAQNTGIVSGTVFDEETGQSVIGASVVIEGTQIGDATNTEGVFRISNAPIGSQTLIITSLGYQDKQFSVTVVGGEEQQVSIELSSTIQDLGELTVTGSRKSQLDAISQKRSSNRIMDVITTDDLGKLPDINVAEATQRIAGVAMETDKGEGKFVSIRGIQPSQNNVTLNGQANLSSTGGSRATALDLLPTEIISSIEVVKAVTPDMEANSLGGSVTINTISAFDRNKPFLVATAEGLIQDRQNTSGMDDSDAPLRFSATGGKKFGKNKKFGGVISTDFFKRDFTVSVIDPDEWIFENGFFLPNENELQIEDNERTRFSLNSDLEYRFTDNNSVYFQSLFTNTEELALNSEFELTFEGDLTNQTATSGRWSAGSMELDFARQDEDETLNTFILGTKNTFGQFTTDIYGSFSKGDTDIFDPDGTFENPENTEDQLPLNFDTSNFFFDVTTPNTAFANDATQMRMRGLNLNSTNIEEENYEVSGDIEYNFLLKNRPGSIKFGGRYRDRDIFVDSDRQEFDLDGEGGIEATNPLTLDRFRLDPWDPEQGGQNPFHHSDVKSLASFVSNPDNLDPSIIQLEPVESEVESLENDINNEETVTAGYVMGSFNISKLQVISGFRVEHTSTTSNGNVVSETDNGIAFDVITDGNTYTNILPSVHLKYNLNERATFRFAWTNTIARPDFSDLSATSFFEVEETSTPGEFDGSFETANADLEPLRSTNYDLVFSYFFPNGGMFSTAGFYKDIEDQIFTAEQQLDDVEFRGFFFNELEIESLENAEEASLLGVEFTYDQPFTFLPNFFNGFGATLNMAFMESDVDLETRKDLPLFRQPEQVMNGVLYYEKKGIEFRFSASHRGKFLTEAATFNEFEDEIAAGASITDFDRWRDDRTTFDVIGAYNFQNYPFRVSVQARNITNESEQNFQGIQSRLDRHQLTGRTVFLTINLSL